MLFPWRWWSLWGIWANDQHQRLWRLHSQRLPGSVGFQRLCLAPQWPAVPRVGGHWAASSNPGKDSLFLFLSWKSSREQCSQVELTGQHSGLLLPLPVHLLLHQGWPLAATSLFLSLISSDELKFSPSHPTGTGWSCGWVDSMSCAGVTSPNHHHHRDGRALHSKHRGRACGNEFWRLMPNNTKECSFFFNSFVFSASQFHKSTLLFYSEKGPVHSQSHSLALTPLDRKSVV